MVSVLDINLNSDQVSRNHLSKINSRISQQAEKSQLNYIKEINDPTKQISLWENNNLEKRVSSLFSKIYQRTTANNAVTSASSDYLIPTGGILIETEQEESSNLMTWIREQGRTIQKVTNDAFYWIDTELGEDAVSIAAEISKIKGIKTSKPSFKTVKLDQ